MAKYIDIIAGILTQLQPVNTSAGAGDAGKIAQLDAAGRWDNSMMPVGIGADTAIIESSENLAAGDFVNIFDSTGAKVRKADASNGREAHGFVLAGVTSPANATVYFEGQNTQVSGLTPGAKVYLSGSTPGQATETPPSTSAYIVQRLGTVITATNVSVELGTPVTLV